VVSVVVVEHWERLGRMNIGLVEAALVAQDRRLVVSDDGEVDDDDDDDDDEVDDELVRDMTEALTSFCARLYGRRAAKNRAARALAAAEPVHA